MEAFIKKLVTSDFDEEDIGVITPYHSQVLALRRKLKSMKKLRVGTVEEFQGEEKMVIAFSAVKTSGYDKALRFIYCPKRLNTAVSRARFVTQIESKHFILLHELNEICFFSLFSMLVVIFGKASLLKGDPNWNALIEYCVENNAYLEGKDVVQIL